MKEPDWKRPQWTSPDWTWPAGKRIAAVWKPAALGACVGIALRTVGHILLG